MQEVRSLALQHVCDLVWIEKVKFETTTPGQAQSFAEDGPLEELHALIQELRDNEASLKESAAPLDELKKKLPVDLQGDDLPLDDPANLRRLLDQVEPLLLERLLNVEAGS